MVHPVEFLFYLKFIFRVGYTVEVLKYRASENIKCTPIVGAGLALRGLLV